MFIVVRMLYNLWQSLMLNEGINGWAILPLQVVGQKEKQNHLFYLTSTVNIGVYINKHTYVHISPSTYICMSEFKLIATVAALRFEKVYFSRRLYVSLYSCL